MDAETVLSFWLGELDENGLCATDQAERWWEKNPAFDDLVRAASVP